MKLNLNGMFHKKNNHLRGDNMYLHNILYNIAKVKRRMVKCSHKL